MMKKTKYLFIYLRFENRNNRELKLDQTEHETE